jgi:hypothetical protein
MTAPEFACLTLAGPDTRIDIAVAPARWPILKALALLPEESFSFCAVTLGTVATSRGGFSPESQVALEELEHAVNTWIARGAP